MSGEKNEQRPEGRLLYAALREKGLSFRQLGDLIKLSEARVRNIVNGYQAVGHGQRIEVVGPQDTLARMAAALDVTPEQLEAAGRGDAAESLRRRAPGGVLPEWAGGDESAIWRSAVATSEEIRQWAEDPFNMLPPDAILEQFPSDALVGELATRIASAEQRLGAFYWHSGEAFGPSPRPKAAEG